MYPIRVFLGMTEFQLCHFSILTKSEFCHLSLLTELEFCHPGHLCHHERETSLEFFYKLFAPIFKTEY